MYMFDVCHVQVYSDCVFCPAVAIDCYSSLEGREDVEGEGGWRGEGEGVRGRLTSLERVLKCLENVSIVYMYLYTCTYTIMI